MEDKFSQDVYGTMEPSQCKNCKYNYNYNVCEYYKGKIPKKYLFNNDKCMHKTYDNEK